MAIVRSDINFDEKVDRLVSYQNISFDNRRLLEDSNNCDLQAKTNPSYSKYFSALKKIYSASSEGTCVPVHLSCGWPAVKSSLPMFVLSVGLEGAGHHLWTELFDKPVFDCVWVFFRNFVLF